MMCSGEQENTLFAKSVFCCVMTRVERWVRDKQREGRVRGRLSNTGKEVVGGTETSRAKPRYRSCEARRGTSWSNKSGEMTGKLCLFESVFFSDRARTVSARQLTLSIW